MISVTMPTCNRADKLPDALEHLLVAARKADQQVDITIVDNRSTDGTKDVIESFARSSSGVVRYMWEPRPGISHARNTGLRATTGDIIAFTDDDCRVAEDWLLRIGEKFAADPALAVLGGRLELADPTDLPVSIRTEKYAMEYRNPGDLNLIVGANFAIRRSILRTVGGFDPRLGVGSRRGLSSEDVEFVYRAYKAGLRIAYFPDVLGWHAHGRKTSEDRRRLTRSYFRGRGALTAKHALRGDSEAVRNFYWYVRSNSREHAAARRQGQPAGGEWREILLMLDGAFWGMEQTLFAAGEPTDW